MIVVLGTLLEWTSYNVATFFRIMMLGQIISSIWAFSLLYTISDGQLMKKLNWFYEN